MSMGSLSILCLGWFLGQVPSDIFFTNQRSHRIPLNFQDARRAEIRDLILYASNDQGKTWQQVEIVSPDKDAFTFNAPTDGQYWLQVAAVNRQGKQEPENINQSPPQQKMIIDTLKPLVRVTSAQRQKDDIVVAWEIQEDNPDWASFKLEYQISPSSQWEQVKTAPKHTGQAQFTPGNLSPVSVRLHLRDQAGNVAVASAEVQGTVPSLAQQIPTPGPSVPVVPVSASAAVPPPPSFPPVPSFPPTKVETPVPPPVTVPPTTPPPAVEVPRETPRNVTPPPAPEKVTPSSSTSQVWSPSPAQLNPRADVGTKVVASSDQQPAPVSPPPAPLPTRKPLPPLQYVNCPEITLEYELTKVGPSGVGSVELWWTRDDGQTWEKYAFDSEDKKPGRHQRTVELPGEGQFGFQLVVKSPVGRGRREPRPGDAPEIRVEVDTLAPVAQLFAPVPDTQRSNSLQLSWSAKDKNLTTHPITLEWAERREGPWNIIAANQANTGHFSWALPDQIPVQVFLRLRVRDCAGNESMAITAEPQIVDLSEPEGRLINVSIPPRR